MTEREDARPGKSDTAFRTIGELSVELGVPQHVLRYWEQRFPQLRPVQRAGKRRYYRPDDVALARRIHRLLTVEGYTVRGVQQLLGRPVAAQPAAAEGPAPANPSPAGPARAPAASASARPAASASPPPAAGAAAPAGLSEGDRRALMRVRDMLAVALAED